jgi:holo-[acyl-carrier protein] synthase
MILGLGSDLIDIRRIEETIARFGDRFLDRIFTAAERQKCERRASPAASYARRFAAKEACAKALGTGFRDGVFWRDLAVVSLPSGQPTMRLSGGALLRLKEMTPAGMTARLDVSLTDEPPIAQAVVIISALPSPAELSALPGA